MKTYLDCKEIILKSKYSIYFDRYGGFKGIKLQHKFYQEVAELYARECCQASLNKAAIEGVEYSIRTQKFELDKSAITDPSNIVLL